ncbi:MAG: cell division FtsA domain-containing protein [Bacilli bacterium]|nr:cell division FtsA domain-containing protein [Bacilli bacterium]
MRKIMASLDIGANALKLVVAETVGEKLNILGVSTIPNNTIKKGKIINKEELVNKLKELFKDINDRLGFEVTKTLVIVPSSSAEFTLGTGKINVKSEDGIITAEDIVSVVKKSAYHVVQDNMELVTIMPINYTLEDGTKVLEPKNLISKTLEVKTVIISALKSEVYDYLECLEKINVDVVDIAFASIGDYFQFRNKEFDKQVGAIINIGEQTTCVSIINKGVLTNTSTTYLGGSNVTNDIAYIYKIDKEKAKDIKEEFALAHKRMAISAETINIKNKEEKNISINQYEVSEVVESRLKEILNLAKKQINVLTKKEISYIILTGGVTETKDFNLVAESIFGKNVTLGNIHELGVRNNIYSSVVGIIKWYDYNQKLKNREYSLLNIKEQEEFSKLSNGEELSSNGVIGKVFGYFFD